MRGRFLLLALLFLPLALHGQEVFFKSNSFGMLLERIAPYRRDESQWILGVLKTANSETRRLYDKGKEVHRWDASWGANPRQKVERETADGVITARRVYDGAGNLVQEEQYTDGALSQKTLSTYSGARLMRTRVLAGDGSVLYTDQYLYSLRGSLREVRRTGEGGKAQDSSFVIGPTGISEERARVGKTDFIVRYDTRGRITNREDRAEGKIVSRQDFLYRSDTQSLLSSTEKLPAEGTLIRRVYDENGRLATETTTKGSSVVEEMRYTRNSDGTVTSKTRTSALGRELWKYALDAKGKVTREEYYVRGSLEKVTIYGEGNGRAEELYKDGEMFLKVFYDGEVKVREEVYAGGVLLRERKYP